MQTGRESSKTFETKVPDTIYREQELMFVLLILVLPWTSIFFTMTSLTSLSGDVYSLSLIGYNLLFRFTECYN